MPSTLPQSRQLDSRLQWQPPSASCACQQSRRHCRSTALSSACSQRVPTPDSHSCHRSSRRAPCNSQCSRQCLQSIVACPYDRNGHIVYHPSRVCLVTKKHTGRVRLCSVKSTVFVGYLQCVYATEYFSSAATYSAKLHTLPRPTHHGCHPMMLVARLPTDLARSRHKASEARQGVQLALCHWPPPVTEG